MILAWNLDDGSLHVFRAYIVVLATGGYGRAYFSATALIHVPVMVVECV